MAAKIIAIYNSKGGQGKSTVSIILGSWAGLKGLKVAVVDGDDGRTIFDWVQARKQAGKPVAFEIALISEFDFGRREINEKSDYDWIFIDFPAAFNSKIADALGYCDLLILPVKIGEAELFRLRRLFQSSIVRDIPKVFVLNQILWFEKDWLSSTKREIKSLAQEFKSPLIEMGYRSDYGKLMQGRLFWDGRKPKLYSGDLWDELRDLFQAVGLPV